MKTFELNGIELDLDFPILSNRVRYGINENKDYEKEEYKLINKYLPDEDVIELGGGIGYISCVINNKISFEKTQLVIEPTLELVRIIESNMALNNCMFKIINRAYHPHEQSVELAIYKDIWNNSTENIGTDDPVINTEPVRTTSIQKLVNTYIERKFSLVVDIEGAEKYLIESDDYKLINNKCELMIVELHTKELVDKFKSNFTVIDRKNNVYVLEP